MCTRKGSDVLLMIIVRQTQVFRCSKYIRNEWRQVNYINKAIMEVKPQKWGCNSRIICNSWPNSRLNNPGQVGTSGIIESIIKLTGHKRAEEQEAKQGINTEFMLHFLQSSKVEAAPYLYREGDSQRLKGKCMKLCRCS